MTEWNKDLENKILRKSKFTLTLRILRVLAIIIFLYAIYMIVANIIVDKLNVGRKNMYFSSLALEWTIPNVRGEFEIKEDELTIFGTKNFSFNLIKTVGEKEVVVGEAQVSKKLLNSISAIHYSHPGLQQLNGLSFSLPEDPRTGRKLEANTWPHVWGTLEKLPEGTVAELAFSTTEFMEARQLIEALADYDLHVLWMPLYTGEFKDYEPYGHSGNENLIMVSDILGQAC